MREFWGGGQYPLIPHRFCANPTGGPGGKWGVNRLTNPCSCFSVLYSQDIVAGWEEKWPILCRVLDV